MKSILEVAKLDIVKRNSYLFVQQILFVFLLDFPGGSDGEELACNAGDLGSIPVLGRSRGG